MRNLIGERVQILSTGEVGEVEEHFTDTGDIEVWLESCEGTLLTTDDEVKLIDDIKYACPHCGGTIIKSQLEIKGETK